MENLQNNSLELSIIIPVYNCEKYLDFGFEKIKPIYSTGISFEIIYVNDGSTDNSLEVLQRIQLENDFIKIISQENQGSSGARNTAIDVAKGKYIQFLDADDKIEVEELILILKKAVDLDLDAICYRMDFINELDEKIGEMNANTVTFDKIMSGSKALIEGYHPSSICVFLFKTEFLNANNLRITPKITHMDVEFTSRMMLVCQRILFLDVVVYHYLQRQGSITKPKSKEKLMSFLYDEVLISEMIKNTIEDNFDRQLINAIEKNYNSVVWNLLFRFLVKPKETDFEFKKHCLKELRAKKLYPIKGALKTSFQNKMRIIFNFEIFYKLILKIRS